MMIKKKSLLVALISSAVISIVLILTLVGYIAYLEIKSDETRRESDALLKKIDSARR